MRWVSLVGVIVILAVLMTIAFAAVAVGASINETYRVSPNLTVAVGTPASLAKYTVLEGITATVSSAMSSQNYRVTNTVSATIETGTQYNTTVLPRIAARVSLLYNSTFIDHAGPVLDAPEPGHVYDVILCLYAGYTNTTLYINMSGALYAVNVTSSPFVCVNIYNWTAPLSLWYEDLVIGLYDVVGNETKWSETVVLRPHRYTRVKSYSYSVEGATVTVKAVIAMNTSGLPALGEDVSLIVDDRNLSTKTATLPSRCLATGYVYAMTSCESVVVFTFTASPGTHTVEIAPAHGVASKVFTVEITASPWQPGGFNYTVTPVNVTLGNWTPPGPFSVPVDLSPTSPTGILLYMLVLAAYIGLANRLGWAEAFVPLSVILVGLGVLYGSTPLITAGVLALVAGVVLRYLR